MLKFKKHIVFLLVLSLFLPLAVQASHAFEQHEHTVCKSVLDTHIHKKDLNCSDLHQILEINSVSFSSDFIPRSPIFYLTNFTSETTFVSSVYLSKKSSRGPPLLVF